MKRLGLATLLLLAVSACAQTNAPQQRTMNWDQIGAGTKVAKVHNAKSLISPGFY